MGGDSPLEVLRRSDVQIVVVTWELGSKTNLDWRSLVPTEASRRAWFVEIAFPVEH